MDQKQLASTLKKQRDALMVEPIHATFEPVRAYATQISTVKGVPHSVVTIPESSAAHSMGYRYASIPNTELDHYLANGAMLASDANQRTSHGPVGGPACPDCGAAHAPGQNTLCHN